jgi:hypothetical protein
MRSHFSNSLNLLTMVTKFQEKLSKYYNTLWKIIKLYHPDVDDKHFDKFKSVPVQLKGGRWTHVNKTVYLKYDWVVIDYHIRGYGDISLRIENCKNSGGSLGIGLFGPKVTKKDMLNAIAQGNVQMYIGRFANDKLYSDTNEMGIKEYLEEKDPIALELGIQILKNAGYTIQSVDEWYKIYYSD